MKHRKVLQILLFVAVVTATSGCRIVWTDPPTPTPVPTATATATLSPTPTDTPTPVPTETLTPTITLVPTQSIEAIANAFMPVTEEKGVPEASAYDPTKIGIHPIIIISAEDQAVWNKRMPKPWLSMNVGQTELVGIVRINRVIMERRKINTLGFIYRIRTDTEVWLREAQTAKLIAYTIFEGDTPPPFNSWSRRATNSIGSPVSVEVVMYWLKEYVEK